MNEEINLSRCIFRILVLYILRVAMYLCCVFTLNMCVWMYECVSILMIIWMCIYVYVFLFLSLPVFQKMTELTKEQRKQMNQLPYLFISESDVNSLIFVSIHRYNYLFIFLNLYLILHLSFHLSMCLPSYLYVAIFFSLFLPCGLQVYLWVFRCISPHTDIFTQRPRIK